MRKWYLLVLMPVALFFAASALLLEAPAVEAPDIGGYMILYGDLEFKNLDNIPPDCSYWLRIYPEETLFHQDGYADSDGDGKISAGDVITLEGHSREILWAGPMYRLELLGEDRGKEIVEIIVSPDQLKYHDPGEPTGTWHVVRPASLHCNPFEIGHPWQDVDESGTVTVCDIISERVHEGESHYYRDWHVKGVYTGIIHIAPLSTQNSTWSRVKDWFRNLGN